MGEQTGSESQEEHSSAWANFGEWVGILAGPFAWALHQETSYALVQWACHHRMPMVLHWVSLAFLLIALGGTFLSWRLYLRVRRRPLLDSEDSDAPRPEFMTVLGMATSSLFALVILAQAIPSFILDPCFV